VRDAVDRTRAAGILARLETINPVFIAGAFYLVPDVTVPETADAILEHLKGGGAC
jgi:hypothetical protein